MATGVRFVGDNREETAKALHRLAREQMKQRLLADILADISVCNLEGWEWREHLKELKQIVDGILEEDNG